MKKLFSALHHNSRLGTKTCRDGFNESWCRGGKLLKFDAESSLKKKKKKILHSMISLSENFKKNV